MTTTTTEASLREKKILELAQAEFTIQMETEENDFEKIYKETMRKVRESLGLKFVSDTAFRSKHKETVRQTLLKEFKKQNK